jgi:hypothetical protein
MKVLVVELYHQGIQKPLAAAKAEPPLVGELFMNHRLNTRISRTAELMGPGLGDPRSLSRDIVLPLLDATIHGIKDGSFVLTGIQRRHDSEGAMHEERQAWWIRPAPSDAPYTTWQSSQPKVRAKEGAMT